MLVAQQFRNKTKTPPRISKFKVIGFPHDKSEHARLNINGSHTVLSRGGEGGRGLGVTRRLHMLTTNLSTETGFVSSKNWFPRLSFRHCFCFLRNCDRLSVISSSKFFHCCSRLFPTLSTGYIFSRAWHWLHIFPCLALPAFFPRLPPAGYFPALGNGCIFSRAWHLLLNFQLLAPVTYFPALGTGCIFPRAYHRLHDVFSRAWFLLHIFPHLALAGYFPSVGTGCMFSCA